MKENSMSAWVWLTWALGLGAAAWAAPGEVAWQFAAGNEIFSSPCVDGQGNLYFGSLDNRVYSLDEDGNERWSFSTGDWVESSPALSPDESAIYVGSWDNKVYALRASDGAKLWDFETLSLVFASPAVAQNGTVYVGGSDGILYALNSDGSLRWEALIGGELDSSPVIDADGNIYVASTTGDLFGYDSQGQVLWQFSVPDEAGALGRDKGLRASPMLKGDGRLYMGCQNHFLYALDLSNGQVAWKFETGGIIESPAVAGIDGSILFSSRDGYVYALDGDGNLLWRTWVGANYYSSPVVDEIGRIYVGSTSDGATGRLNWLTAWGGEIDSFAVDGFIDSSPAIDGDGVLYFGTTQGTFYAMDAGGALGKGVWPKGRRGLASRASLEGYAAPETLNGRLINISLRGAALGGEENIIAGFFMRGEGEKTLLVRAVGPALAKLGIEGYLEDPMMDFFRKIPGTPEFELKWTNDHWWEEPDPDLVAQKTLDMGALELDAGSLDSSAVLVYGQGVYSAVARSANENTGITLVEVFDTDDADTTIKFENISMRGRIGLGDEVLIMGFVVRGNQPRRLLVRAVGPSLLEIGNRAMDTEIHLFNKFRQLDSNDDWEKHPDLAELEQWSAVAGARELEPGLLDAALLVWVEPGPYTAVASSETGEPGIALVEAYDLTDRALE